MTPLLALLVYLSFHPCERVCVRNGFPARAAVQEYGMCLCDARRFKAKPAKPR